MTAAPGGAAGGPAPRSSIFHCHLPEATPDCPTCVEVHGSAWAAEQRQHRTAAASQVGTGRGAEAGGQVAGPAPSQHQATDAAREPDAAWEAGPDAGWGRDATDDTSDTGIGW